jgi:hypothetical protein
MELPAYVRRAVADHLPELSAFVTANSFESVHTMGYYPTIYTSGIVNLGLPGTGTGLQTIGFWYLLPNDNSGTPWAPPADLYPNDCVILALPAQVYLYTTGGGPEIMSWMVNSFTALAGTGPDQNNVLVLGSISTFGTQRPESDVYVLRVAYQATIAIAD